MLQTLPPVDQKDFLAVFIAEGISGFLGGLASKSAANLSERRQSRRVGLIDAGASSGAYFGVVAGTRSILRVLGVSPILLNIIALTFAASAASIFKYRRQLVAPQRTRVGNGPSMYELMKFKDPSMLDLTKFSIRLIEFLTASSPTLHIEDAAALGAVVGPISQFVREKDDRKMAAELARTRSSAARDGTKRLEAVHRRPRRSVCERCGGRRCATGCV